MYQYLQEAPKSHPQNIGVKLLKYINRFRQLYIFFATSVNCHFASVGPYKETKMRGCAHAPGVCCADFGG